MRLKSSSQKYPSQYRDTALMRHTFRNECNEANLEPVSDTPTTCPVRVPLQPSCCRTVCTDPYIRLASACLGCVAILRWVLLRRTFEMQRPGRTHAVGVRLGRLECGLTRDIVSPCDNQATARADLSNFGSLWRTAILHHFRSESATEIRNRFAWHTGMAQPGFREPVTG